MGSIHEVMEQQTVSVAKVGIVATLNARTAIIAAASPVFKRYNYRKSLSENVNMPDFLLSLFDFMFLILDVADAQMDVTMTRHVTFVHQNEGTGGVGQVATVPTDGDTDLDEEYFEDGEKGEGDDRQ